MANRFTKIISKVIPKTIKNYILTQDLPPFKGGDSRAINPYTMPFTMQKGSLPQYYIMPLQLDRVATDVKGWRDAIGSAENALYPTRYNMQKMFADTILEGHTFSCMRKMKRKTLLKDFVIKDAKGNIDEEATALIKNKRWFKNMIGWILDAQFYGYSFIQLGDMISPRKGEYNFPQMTNIRRWNVEPDRQNLVSIPLQKTGVNFLYPSVKGEQDGESYYDHSIYIDTPTDIGHSICGYGLLYNVAIYAILLRNNLGDNADYNEKFGTPYRQASLPAGFDKATQDIVDAAMQNLGAMGYGIFPDSVAIKFHESNTGAGFQTFDNLEQRLEKMITKIILGHPSAMDEPPGKLGGGQGANKNPDEDASPAGAAMVEAEKDQDDFVLDVLNSNVINKLRTLGMPFPKDKVFAVTNDKEEFAARKKKDEADLVTATIAQTMKNAGLKMPSDYFKEVTGIEAEKIAEPTPQPGLGAKKFSPQLNKKLEKIYGKHSH